MAVQLSVIVAQYRPDAAALRRTLWSIARQSWRDFEVILADDGSDEDFFADSCARLKAQGVPVTCSKMQPNGGTVRNLQAALTKAQGAWVQLISPGDYLYDADTLAWLMPQLEGQQAAVVFGHLAHYRMVAGAPQPCAGDTPFDRTPYDPDHYRAKQIKRNLLLYDDGICGAGLVYRRDALQDMLNLMAGRVRFAEDFSVRAFAVQGQRIARVDRPLAWYEAGEGISTTATQRMLTDWKAMLKLLREQFPRDYMVRKAYCYYFNDERTSRLVRGIVGRCLVPQWLPFKRAQKAWQPPVIGEAAVLQQLYREAQDWESAD